MFEYQRKMRAYLADRLTTPEEKSRMQRDHQRRMAAQVMDAVRNRKYAAPLVEAASDKRTRKAARRAALHKAAAPEA